MLIKLFIFLKDLDLEFIRFANLAEKMRMFVIL